MGRKILTQLVATGSVMMLTTQTGIIDGWTSPNMARLTEANSTIPLTLSEASWLASWLKFGRFVSVILMPLFIDLAGSKKAILYTFIPVSISWLLTMLARSAISLYIARFLAGITYGLAFGCFPIYLGEVSIAELRGTFIAVATIGWPLGVLIGTAVESHLSEVVSCTMYLVQCFFGICLFLWLPESPYRLTKSKEYAKARKSLDWYLGHEATDREMKEIVEFVEETSRATLTEKIEQLRSPTIRNAVILTSLVYSCPQVCGIFNVIFYMEIILTNAKSHLIEPSQTVVYANVILVVTAVLTVKLADKLGRRILLISSMASMTLGFFGLGLHHYLLDKVKVDPVSIQILPIVWIVILIISFATAYSPVMNALLGELFPAGIKSSAAMIVTMVAAFVGFITTWAYQLLIDAIGEAYVFWMYALFMVILIPIVQFLLTETKGKSLQQIQNALNDKRT